MMRHAEGTDRPVWINSMRRYLLHSEVSEHDGYIQIATKCQFYFESTTLFWDTVMKG